jgi:hypothetical protein
MLEYIEQLLERESGKKYCTEYVGIIVTIPSIIAGHNQRWIDGSTQILSIDTLGHADH